MRSYLIGNDRVTVCREASAAVNEGEFVIASDGATVVLALIERVALDPGADAAKLERIVAMYERLKAREAERAFNAAKGRILKKLAGITIVKNRPALYQIDKGKPQKGSYEAFKYAPLEEIDK